MLPAARGAPGVGTLSLHVGAWVQGPLGSAGDTAAQITVTAGNALLLFAAQKLQGILYPAF